MRLAVEIKTHRIYLHDFHVYNDCENSDKKEVSIQSSVIINDTEVVHYIKNVLRLSKDMYIRVFNGTYGEYLCSIIYVDKKSVIVQLLERLQNPISTSTDCTKLYNKDLCLKLKIDVAICIVKGSQMSECVDIATQMGCDTVIPVISSRTQYSDIKLDKLERASIHSAEQSERISVPSISAPIKISKLLQEHQNIIIADENMIVRSEISSNNMYIISSKDNVSYNENQLFSIVKNIILESTVHTGFIEIPITLLIGPEGGFSDDERELFEKYGCYKVRLSNNILRTKVAIAVMMSQLQFVLMSIC